jgi:DNA polymerase-3 subunit gamma/tau
MDYQVSARKYRPGTFDDVIGQPHVVQTLVNSITTQRIAHAFLFSGTRGVGKTTVARILAKALNCEQGPTGRPCNACPNCVEITQGTSVDVIEIDGASNTSVDDVREIRENVKFTPFRGKYRVYIIDEVHMLSNSAFNALLKTLEEPPAHVVFIFATTEIHKIPATILSRCQHYNFRRIARSEIIQRLRHVANQDSITVEDRSLTALARSSEGSMRDALSLLDQAVAFGGKTINHTDLEVLLGAVPQEHVRGMIAAVAAQNSPAALLVVAQLLDQGHELRAYCAELVEYVRNLLVARIVPSPQELRGLVETSDEDLRQLVADAKAFTPESLQELFRIFTQAEDALRFSAHPRFVLETAAVRATRLLPQKEQGAPQPVPIVKVESPTPRPAAAPEPRRTQSPPLGPKAAPPPPERTAPTTVTRASGQAGTPSRPDATPSRDPAVAAPGTDGREEARVEKPVAPMSHPVPDTSTMASDAAASPTFTLDWEQFQEEVASAHPNIAPFLEMGRLAGIEGNLVTIGFAKQATVARAMLEKEDNLRMVAALCRHLSGQAVRLRVVELADDAPPGLTMAQVRAAKEQEQRLVLFQQARANPLVKQALEIFGGDLAEVRQVSPQQEGGE